MKQESLFGSDFAPKAQGAFGSRSEAVRAKPVGAPYSNGSTSREAAERIVGALNDLQKQVLSALRERGDDGATNEEIEGLTGLSGNTVRPRVLECRDRGLVIDSGRTRKTRSNRNAIVWKAVI